VYQPGAILTVNRNHWLCPTNWYNILPAQAGGGTLVDVVGGQHCKIVGGAKWSGQKTTGGRVAMSLDGTTGYCQNVNYQPFASAAKAQATMSMWCYSGLSGGSGGGWGFYADTSGDFQFGIYPDFQGWLGNTRSSNGNIYQANVASLTQSVWHHIVCTVDYVALKLATYVDGGASSTTTTIAGAGIHIISTGGLLLGKDNEATPAYAPANTWSDFRLYTNRAFNAQQVWALYQNSLAGCPGLLEWVAPTIATPAVGLGQKIYQVNQAVQQAATW
jgi:hypothetical protein